MLLIPERFLLRLVDLRKSIDNALPETMKVPSKYLLLVEVFASPGKELYHGQKEI